MGWSSFPFRLRVRERIPVPRPVPRPLRFLRGALCTSDGSPATLRGVSLFWSQWAPAFYNEKVVEWLADDWRIDILRVPVAATAPGYLSDPCAETAKAVTVIDAAIRLGLYVIVDWHGHEPHTSHACAFFETLARRYGDVPNLLYEIWNEPAPGYDWPGIVRHHEAVIHRIRRHAPNAVVLCGTPDFCTGLEAAMRLPVPAGNVGYTFHFYAASHRSGLRTRLDHALDAELPVFVSEWGPSEADGDGVLDFEEADRWLGLLETRSVSPVCWAVHDKAEASALLGPGASPEGRWRRRDLSASGRWVRDRLRCPGQRPGSGG